MKFSDGGAGEGTVNITTGAGIVNISQTRGLYVGTGGTLDVGFSDGSNAQFTNVASGSWPALRITVIHTATTANNIVALY